MTADFWTYGDYLVANPLVFPAGLKPNDIYPCKIDFILWEYSQSHAQELKNNYTNT